MAINHICTTCRIELPRKRKLNMCGDCKYSYDKKRKAEELVRYKEFTASLGCSCCGFSNPNALEVHHLTKGSKRFTSGGSRGQSHQYNLKDLSSGVAILLCANCHLIFHAHWGGRRADFPDQTREQTIEIINESRRIVT